MIIAIFIILKNILNAFKEFLNIISINILSSFKNVDWNVRFIGILLLFMYLLLVLIFGERGPYIPPSQNNMMIKNGIIIEKEINKR